jgi:large subunit ribosomal protein L29
MKAEKLRGIDAAELQRQIQDSQEQLFRIRFQMGMGQSEGLKKYRALRKDRARMLTVLNEKRAAGETIPEPAPVGAGARQAAAAPKKRRSLFGRNKEKK